MKSNITDRGIAALMPLTHLEQLVINEGDQLTDESLRTISRLPALRELHISRAVRITDNGLLQLAEAKRLTSLYIELSPTITSDAVARFRKRLPGADIRITNRGQQPVVKVSRRTLVQLTRNETRRAVLS